MKRIVIAPDSFKGTLEAEQVCNIIAGEVKKLCPEAEILCIPMSDGGEGMCASYISIIGGERRSLSVIGPKGSTVEAEFGILPDGSAVTEMAACAGLPLMGGELAPLTATTYGVGELIMHIASLGCEKLLLGLGGSATNDCGIGMAAALGYRFLDAAGEEVMPLAENLGRVERIAPPETLTDIRVRAACDVDNPLCGQRGAAAVFGPQKGGAKEDLGRIDAAVENWAKVITEWKHGGASAQNTGPSWNYPGAGAAGGTGFALHTVLGAQLKPGWKVFADLLHIEDEIKEAELVVTGEGKLDMQSLSGKLVSGIASLCRKYRRPLWVVTGKNELPPDVISETGITRIVDLTEVALRAGTSPFANPAGLITLSV